MQLTASAIQLFKDLLTNPEANMGRIPLLKDCFNESATGTAKHILYKEYLEYIDRHESQLPKVVWYIIMDELYPVMKCADGNAGYPLTIKDDKPEQSEPNEKPYE